MRSDTVKSGFDRVTVMNAFALDMAMGGSTNTVLHTPAIAHEAGIDFALQELNELAQRVPYICKVSPASKEVHMKDVNRAGGVSAILNELSKVDGALELSRPTVTGQTLGENIAHAAIKDNQVIRSTADPYSAMGSLAILFGNLAPNGSVVKVGAVDKKMLNQSSPARIYKSQ